MPVRGVVPPHHVERAVAEGVLEMEHRHALVDAPGGEGVAKVWRSLWGLQWIPLRSSRRAIRRATPSRVRGECCPCASRRWARNSSRWKLAGRTATDSTWKANL